MAQIGASVSILKVTAAVFSPLNTRVAGTFNNHLWGGEMKEKWTVIEQPCGCCGVKNEDGTVWGYPMVKGAAEAVVDFANWLER